MSINVYQIENSITQSKSLPLRFQKAGLGLVDHKLAQRVPFLFDRLIECALHLLQTTIHRVSSECLP